MRARNNKIPVYRRLLAQARQHNYRHLQAMVYFRDEFLLSQLLNASKHQPAAAVIFLEHPYVHSKYLPTIIIQSLHQLPFRVQTHTTGKTNIHLALTVQHLTRFFKPSTFLYNIQGVCVPFRYISCIYKAPNNLQQPLSSPEFLQSIILKLFFPQRENCL